MRVRSRAMFALTVRSLDGSCRHLEVGADTTATGLREELERSRSLPTFHEVKLFYGTQELRLTRMQEYGLWDNSALISLERKVDKKHDGTGSRACFLPSLRSIRGFQSQIYLESRFPRKSEKKQKKTEILVIYG